MPPGERAARTGALTRLINPRARPCDEQVIQSARGAVDCAARQRRWVLIATILASFLLIGGAAGDQFGRRRIFIVGVVIFAVASVCCGLAPNVGLLIGARAVQGIGAALLIPCSLAIIGASFPEAERGRAIGTWAGFSAIAAAIGPLLGGWIVDHLTWRAIFLINPFLAIPVIGIAWRHLPESYDPTDSPGIDWSSS